MSLIKNKLRILFLFIGVLTFINSSSVIAKSTNTFNDTIQYFKDKRISNSLEKIRLIEEIEFLIKKSVKQDKYDNLEKLASEDEKFIVNIDFLNLREKPAGQIIDQLSKDEKVISIESQGIWFKVITSDNKIGWVSSEYLKVNSSNFYKISKLQYQILETFYLNQTNFNLQKQNLTEEFLLKAHSNSLLEKNEQLLYNENGSRLLSLIQFLISGYDGIDVSNICSKEEYSETYLNAFSCTNIQDTFLKTEINNFCDDLDITFHKEDKTIFYIGCYFENEYQNENSIAELIDIYIKQMYEESKLFIFHYDWEEPITNQVDQFSYDQTTIYSWFFDFNKQMYFYSYCEEKNCLKPKIGIEIGDFSVFFDNDISALFEFEKENIKAILPNYKFEKNINFYSNENFIIEWIEMEKSYSGSKKNNLDNVTTSNKKMTISEIDLLRQQLHSCLNLNVGVANLKEIKPVIFIEVNPDRTVKSAKVVNQERLSDPSFRTAAEAAMRAVNNPDCSPLLLPEDKYDLWKEINFTFDFSWMFD